MICTVIGISVSNKQDFKNVAKDVTGSDMIIYWLGRYSFLLGFIMSKNMIGCVLLNFWLESKITNLFFDIIKPRWKDYIHQVKKIILSVCFVLFLTEQA